MEETVTPPICTGWIFATGVIEPVLPTWYSTFNSLLVSLSCFEFVRNGPSRMMAGHAQLILQINVILPLLPYHQFLYGEGHPVLPRIHCNNSITASIPLKIFISLFRAAKAKVPKHFERTRVRL